MNLWRLTSEFPIRKRSTVCFVLTLYAIMRHLPPLFDAGTSKRMCLADDADIDIVAKESHFPATIARTADTSVSLMEAKSPFPEQTFRIKSSCQNQIFPSEGGWTMICDIVAQLTGDQRSLDHRSLGSFGRWSIGSARLGARGRRKKLRGWVVLAT
jgi:hypothetical protein